MRCYLARARRPTQQERTPFGQWPRAVPTGAATYRDSERGADSLQDAAAARPAQAPDPGDPVGVVVVGQLFAGSDWARRDDPDPAADDVGVAVGAAGVIDVAGDVAAHCGVTDPAIVQVEDPDPVAGQIPLLAAPAFGLRDQLTFVLDNLRVFRNRFRGIDAPAGDRRTAPLDAVAGESRRHCSEAGRRSATVRARQQITGPSWPPMHPGGRRCSSLSYTPYARSSRLARRAPRHPEMAQLFPDGPLVCRRRRVLMPAAK